MIVKPLQRELHVFTRRSLKNQAARFIQALEPQPVFCVEGLLEQGNDGVVAIPEGKPSRVTGHNCRKRGQQKAQCGMMLQLHRCHDQGGPVLVLQQTYA